MTLNDLIEFNSDMSALGFLIQSVNMSETGCVRINDRATILRLWRLQYLTYYSARNEYNEAEIGITPEGHAAYNKWHLNLISTLRLLPTNGVSEQEEVTIRSRWEDVKERRASANPPPSAPTAWNVERLLGA